MNTLKFSALGLAASLVLLASTASAQPAPLPTAEQIKFAKECRDNPRLHKEVSDLSRQAARQFMAEFRPAEVPVSVRLIAFRLIQASPALQAKFPTMSSLELIGYEDSQVHTQLSGRAGLLISSAVWQAPGMGPAEQAAVLAHELAHLEQEDLHLWACLSQAMFLPERLTVEEALQAARKTGNPVISQLLKEMEAAADQRAKRWIEEIGFDPQALERVLSRQDLFNSDSSWSHPSVSERQNALR